MFSSNSKETSSGLLEKCPLLPSSSTIVNVKVLGTSKNEDPSESTDLTNVFNFFLNVPFYLITNFKKLSSNSCNPVPQKPANMM